MLFNKEIIRNNNMEDPYMLVREHKWTFDTFLEMAKAASTEASDDKRVYGLLTGYADALTFIGSTGATICKKDENDYPYLSFGEERTQTVARKVLEAFSSSGTWAIYAQECGDPDLGNLVRRLSRGTRAVQTVRLLRYDEAARI